jgi:hypothetical protein
MTPVEAASARTRTWAAGSWIQCVLVLLAAFCSIAVQVKYNPIVGMGPGFESVAVARSLATKGNFADPFGPPTGATAHLAPLWPFMLAGIYRVAGGERYFGLCTLLLFILVHLLNVLMMFLLAHGLFRDRLSQYCTVAVLLFAPLYQVVPAYEFEYGSVGLLGFWMLARRGRIVVCGLLGGLLLLLSPSLLAILVPIAVYEWRRVKSISVFLILAFLVITPWAIRNHRVFHQTFFIRDNLGLELDVYNNDCEAYGTGQCSPHPNGSAAECAKIREMGEVAYNNMRMRNVMHWFKAHPGAALRLTARRLVGFWFPVSAVAPFGKAIALITAVSLLGFWHLLRTRRTVVWPMLAILALYPPIYYLVRFDLRYRYSVLWVSILAAGYGVARIVELFGPRRQAPAVVANHVD